MQADDRSVYEDVADEIYRLREEKHNLLVENTSKGDLKNRINEMSQFLKN